MKIGLSLSLTAPRGRPLGPELVTNGTFDADTTGWSAASSATLTWGSGKMTVTNGGAATGAAYQTLTTVAGQTYTVTADLSAFVSIATVRVSVHPGAVPNFNGTLYAVNWAAGTASFTFTASSTSSTLAFYVNSATAGRAFSVDNVSAR